MNQVEIARNKLLIALFVDSHRPQKRSLSREQIETEYSARFDTTLFNSLVTELKRSGLVRTHPDRATYFVRLRADAHASALDHILKTLGADAFDVNWQGQRIATDADTDLAHELLSVVPNGWMLMTYAKESPSPPSSPASTPPASMSAGRDLFFFGGNVGQSSITEGSTGSDRWAKAGTVFAGLSVIFAGAAIVAAWYFWANGP